MDFIIRFYIWGIVADLVFKAYGLIMYSFNFKERSTYQANLNKVGLSWDPIYLQVYPLSEFKHTALRFWGTQFADLLGCFLSWYGVLYRVRRTMKVREINSMLTPEQKQASFVLRNDPTLSKEDVIEKLKILDPSLTVAVTEPEDQARHVGYALSFTDCFWCDTEISSGEMVLYYGEPPAHVRWTHKSVIFHYRCAMTLDLYRDTNSSTKLWDNLKERLEASEEIKKLLNKKPELEALEKEDKINDSQRLAEVKEDLDKESDVIMIEMAEAAVFERVVARAADEEEKMGGTNFTKFITELENSSLPLAEFMPPVLEKTQNPIALANIMAALSEEGNHSRAVTEMVREALERALKKWGLVNRVPLTSFMAVVEESDDPVLLAKIKAALEIVVEKNDHPLMAAVNARLEKEKRTF